MTNCPSCAAPLDAEGVCTACGALSRGFFRGLNLGVPQIANAVARGLDFYHLLDVAPAATVRDVARRYRKLRVLFPDDPSQLAPEPARRLSLLETAGRTLTDPQLRQVYDQLRAERQVDLRAEVLRCTGCAAPLEGAPEPGVSLRCPYCGTLAPAASPAPPAPLPADGKPAAEPVDYYALLGLNPAHLTSPPVQDVTRSVELFTFGGPRRADDLPPMPAGPPQPAEVDAAGYAREREVLLAGGLPPELREARAAEVDLARRILRDERRRARYDVLWRAFQQGTMNAGHLEALAALQDEVRAEVAGVPDVPSGEEALALLRQGRGYLDAGLARDALEPLRRAVQALPDSAEAHAAYARAILASGDPLDLGGHLLRQALASIEAAHRLGAPLHDAESLAALCRGLLARDAGDERTAEAELQRAVAANNRLAAGWRALAALALSRGDEPQAISYCGRALAVDRRDERALLMLAAACLRTRQRHQAQDAAAQVAALRGAGWTADDVLREIG
jgi:tetratricopeptide (TPR) repeat protein